MTKEYEVLLFDKLITDTSGLFVKEKIYHTSSGEFGSVMWSVWSPLKKKWSRWHVAFFVIGIDKYWTNTNEFHEFIKEYKPLSIVR